MKTTTKIDGFEKLRRKSRRIPRAIREEVNEAFERNAAEHNDDVVRDIPVRTGGLRSTARYYAVRGTFGTAWVSEVGSSDEFHPAFVEFGTAPQQ